MCIRDSVWAVCFSTSRLPAFFRATASLEFQRLLTIYKPNRVAYPWRSWILTSEVVALFVQGQPEWGTGDHCHDVYTFDYSERPEKSVDHPTVKPLSIIADIIQKVGGVVVYDPFLGSGTTLIAAEQLGRKCYGLEISPAYCDVIVNRWESLTGRKAERNGARTDSETNEAENIVRRKERGPDKPKRTRSTKRQAAGT